MKQVLIPLLPVLWRRGNPSADNSAAGKKEKKKKKKSAEHLDLKLSETQSKQRSAVIPAPDSSIGENTPRLIHSEL